MTHPLHIILFEDAHVADMYPITRVRPAFLVRSAGVTLLEALRIVFPKAVITAECRGHICSTLPALDSVHSEAPRLYLNARLAPQLEALTELAKFTKGAESWSFEASGSAAGFYTADPKITPKDPVQYLKESGTKLSKHPFTWKLFAHPEEVIFFNRDAILDNARYLARSMKNKRKDVCVGKDSTIAPSVVIDTSAGPVIIGDHVVVHHYAVLKGPLVIGDSTIIKEFAVLEGGTTIGPVCRIGGEVDRSVIDGYSNKQHYGYVGDSYIGQWVNLGAGTSVSNLKNTYENIRVASRDSGAQFLGTIMGDYSKAASNTSIFPGRSIGTNAHVYGTVTQDVPAFTAHVRAGAQYEIAADVAVKIQKAMTMRRGVLFTDEDRTRMELAFVQTEKDRTSAGILKEKLSFK